MWYITGNQGEAFDVKAHQEYCTTEKVVVKKHSAKQLWAVRIYVHFEGCVETLPEDWE